ncbi:MAG TPA: YHS domain-containing protein, partial [Paracoccaceae bacterium]|nr:YHS domain-containing protein [Paracoccaceae bacterium]
MAVQEPEDGTGDLTLIRDPVCGMAVDPETAEYFHDHDGHRYYFCSEHCLKTFRDTPTEFVRATDPVCGMSVDRATAKHMATHEGERFYFCSSRC